MEAGGRVEKEYVVGEKTWIKGNEKNLPLWSLGSVLKT